MPWTLSAFADEAGPTTDDQIRALQRGGLTHIDPRSVDGHNITELPVEVAQAAQKKLDAAGITVNMYGSPIGKIDIADDFQTDLDKLDHLGQMKDVFGCGAIRMFSYYNHQGADRATWRETTLDRLKRLKERAGQLGLVLYHENEHEIYGDHPDQVLELAELRDGETFKIIYDFGNWITTGVAGWDAWQMFKDKTDCFHFKDRKVSTEHVPMGQGATDALRILKDAVASGWNGPCTIEPHLTHSKAVLATGVTGTGDQSLADLSPSESFQVAVDAAKELMNQAGVKYQ